MSQRCDLHSEVPVVLDHPLGLALVVDDDDALLLGITFVLFNH